MDISSELRKRGTGLILSGYLLSFLIGAYLTVNASFGFNTYTSGKILGVWSLTALTFQSIIASRAKIIEKLVGYEKITKLHALNGVLIIVLVILHPLLIFSRQMLSGQFTAIYTFIADNPAALLGFSALGLLLFQAASTLYWKSLDYEKWRIIHRIGYIVVGLGFLHSLILGSDIHLLPDTGLSFWWIFLGFITLSGVIYRYIFLPSKRKTYTVRKVESETADVATIHLKPENEILDHEPGQFAFTKFQSENIPEEEHPFTIASSPENSLEFSIKSSGDYTSKIEKLAPGDKAIIEGPYGRFILPEDDPLVLIAGGIGITPFMSMIRFMAGNPKEARETYLLYGNKTMEDIAFRDELEELEKKNDWLEVTHVISEEEKEDFEHGYIGKELLEKYTGEKRRFMVCGPEPMMNSIIKDLKGLDVEKSSIELEGFSLRKIGRKGLL